jgi:hypothetical protein
MALHMGCLMAGLFVFPPFEIVYAQGGMEIWTLWQSKLLHDITPTVEYVRYYHSVM